MKTFSFAEITAQDIRHAIGSIEGIPSPVVEAVGDLAGNYQPDDHISFSGEIGDDGAVSLTMKKVAFPAPAEAPAAESPTETAPAQEPPSAETSGESTPPAAGGETAAGGSPEGATGDVAPAQA